MFKDKSAPFLNNLKYANQEGLSEVAEVYRISMIENMENTKRDPSTVYYGLKGKAVHHPSLPHYPPAILSGEFSKSLETDWNEQNEVSYVWTDVPYALELEFGRSGGDSPPMTAREVWYPTLYDAENAMWKTFIYVARGEMGNYG